ncbi:MAG: hypothetical protein H0T77_01365 [Pyrinomonadaceae bacterium]|nr:hypothetical protein [Pyrinomonadaceae bacterium]
MDENRVSEIERGRFLKDYKIEIIPYKSAAVDHPEVKEFLKELLSGVTPRALRHRMGRAKEMLEEADTHYKLVATTEDEFIVKEKFPGAAEEKPLPFSVELRFDKKTQGGQEALESWQKHIDTGEEITIKSPHLSKFVPPEILSRFLPMPTDEMEMTIGPRRSETKIPIKIIIENESGKTQSLDHIVLEEIQQGKKEITLSNENQDSPWKIHQVIMREDFKESAFTISFTDVGLNVKQALDGWRFWEALSTGGVVTIEWQETGQRFGHTTIPPGAYPRPDPRLMDLLEALVLIQRKLPVRFESPDNVSFEEARIILAVAEILQTGKAELKPETVVLDSTIERVGELIQRFADDASATISSYIEDVPFTVLGKQVTVGPMAVNRQVHIAPDEFASLKRRVETAPASESITANLSPVEGSSPMAKFPDWLPKNEAEQLRKLPFVRSATLKSLLQLLFDAAKTNGDEVDADEFVRLLDDARGQVADDGEPLNALNSCTTDELLILLAPIVQELTTDTKIALAGRLSASGWLPVAESAALFGVDENLIQEKLQNSKAANHSV